MTEEYCKPHPINSWNVFDINFLQFILTWLHTPSVCFVERISTFIRPIFKGCFHGFAGFAFTVTESSAFTAWQTWNNHRYQRHVSQCNLSNLSRIFYFSNCSRMGNASMKHFPFNVWVGAPWRCPPSSKTLAIKFLQCQLSPLIERDAFATQPPFSHGLLAQWLGWDRVQAWLLILWRRLSNKMNKTSPLQSQRKLPVRQGFQ